MKGLESNLQYTQVCNCPSDHLLERRLANEAARLLLQPEKAVAGFLVPVQGVS